MFKCMNGIIVVGKICTFRNPNFIPHRSTISIEVTFEQMMIYDDEKYTFNFYSCFY